MNNHELTLKNNVIKGLSLIEVLVVIIIFAVLGVLVTQSVILTLHGSQKSESIIRARENLDYSLNIIERQLRNANGVTSCDNINTSIINYLDQNGVISSFSCVNTGGANSYIASGSAILTSNTVKINVCSFTCTPASMNTPALVKVELSIQDALLTGIRSASVSASTQIYLRNY